MSAEEQVPSEEHHGSQMLEISNAMVRIYKEHFGRGPTQARSMWVGDDIITVILENTFTQAERYLVEAGEHQRIRETRLIFQYASVAQFCDPIERITGRKVRAFISGTDTAVDGLSVETFVLHRSSIGPARQEMAAI
jgi:uncharacterized protein YbcI